MDDIVADTNKINLDAELVAIRVALAAANQAGRERIEHAIEAGSHLLKVKAHIKRKDGGLRGWLQVHGLSKTVCYDFMLLAKNAESVRSSGHSSIVTALRTLRKKEPRSGGSKTRSKSSTGWPLTKAAWTKATLAERQRFLDEVGVDAVLAAISFNFRAELKHRVAGQQAAMAGANKLDEKVAKSLRHALAQLKSTRIKGMVGHEVINALASINTMIEAHGHDLHEIVGLKFDRAATIEKPAAAKDPATEQAAA